MNIQTNAVTLGNYVNYLEKTYMLHGVSRYDIQGKKILEGEKKYYLNDLAFANFFASTYDV